MSQINRRLSISKASTRGMGGISSKIERIKGSTVSIESDTRLSAADKERREALLAGDNERLIAIDKESFEGTGRAALLPDEIVEIIASKKNAAGQPILDAYGSITPSTLPSDLDNISPEIRRTIFSASIRSPLIRVFNQELENADDSRSKAQKQALSDYRKFWTSREGRELSADLVEDLAGRMADTFAEDGILALENAEKTNPNGINADKLAEAVKIRSDNLAKSKAASDSHLQSALDGVAYITDSSGKRLIDDKGNYVVSKTNRVLLRESLQQEIIKRNKNVKLTDDQYVTVDNPLGIIPAQLPFINTEADKYIADLQDRLHEDAVVRANAKNFHAPNPEDQALNEICLNSNPEVKLSNTNNPKILEIELKEKTQTPMGLPVNHVPGVTYTVGVLNQPSLEPKLESFAILNKAAGTQKTLEHIVEEIQAKTKAGMQFDQAFGEALKTSHEFQVFLSAVTALPVPGFVKEQIIKNKLGHTFPQYLKAFVNDPNEFIKAQLKKRINDRLLEGVLEFTGIIQEKTFQDGRKHKINVITSKPHEIAANVFNRLFTDRVERDYQKNELELANILSLGQGNLKRANYLKLRLWKKRLDKKMLLRRRDEDQGFYAPLITAATFLLRSGVNKIIYEVAATTRITKTTLAIQNALTILENPVGYVLSRNPLLAKVVNFASGAKIVVTGIAKSLGKGALIAAPAYFLLGANPPAAVIAGLIGVSRFAQSFTVDLLNHQIVNKRWMKAIPGLFERQRLLAKDNWIIKAFAGKTGISPESLKVLQSVKVEGKILSALDGFNTGTVAAGLLFIFTGNPLLSIAGGIGIGGADYVIRQQVLPHVKQSLAELKRAFDVTTRLNSLPGKLMRFPILDALWTGMSVNELTNMVRDAVKAQRGEMTWDQYNNIYGFGSSWGVAANAAFNTATGVMGFLTIARFSSSIFSVLSGLSGSAIQMLKVGRLIGAVNPLGIASTVIGGTIGFVIGLATGNMTGAIIGATFGAILGGIIGSAIGNVPGAIVGITIGSTTFGLIGSSIEGWIKEKLGGLYDSAMGLIGAAMGALALLKATNLKQRVEAFVAIGSSMMIFGSVGGTLLLAGATFTPGNAAPPISDISVSKRFIEKAADGSLKYKLIISKNTVDISSAEINFLDSINNYTAEVNSVEIKKDEIGVTIDGKAIKLAKKTFSNFTTLQTDYTVKLNRPLDQFLKGDENLCNTINGEMTFRIVPADKDKSPKIKEEEIKPETRTFNQTVCIDKTGNELKRSGGNRQRFVDTDGLPVKDERGASVNQCSYSIGGGTSHRGYPALDIGVQTGTDVVTVMDGTVIIPPFQPNGYGFHIKIHSKTSVGNLIITYAHLSQILVSEGQTVLKNQVIGLSGSSGYSTGPHLHFQTELNGKDVEPCCIIDCTKYSVTSINRSFSCSVKNSVFYSDPRTQCNL